MSDIILKCPNCGSRFSLPEEVLMPDGRKVKCSSCGQIWYEDPPEDEEDELSGNTAEEDGEHDPFAALQDATKKMEEEESVKAIPDGVKPNSDDDLDKALGSDRRRNPLVMGAASLVFFLLILGIFIALHGPISKNWQGSTAFYTWLGFEPEVPGEGLVFDRVEAQVKRSDEGETISLSGFIINLTSDKQEVPMIKVEVLDANGDLLDMRFLEPPKNYIASEADMNFQAEYTSQKNGAAEVNIGFMLDMPKMQEK